MTTTGHPAIDAMLSQIRRWDLLATSGGRVTVVDDTTILLPVARGYRVRVTYVEGADDYTVAREYVRAGKVSDKGTREHVYCDELSDAVYRAGCYHHDF